MFLCRESEETPKPVVVTRKFGRKQVLQLLELLFCVRCRGCDHQGPNRRLPDRRDADSQRSEAEDSQSTVARLHPEISP